MLRTICHTIRDIYLFIFILPFNYNLIQGWEHHQAWYMKALERWNSVLRPKGFWEAEHIKMYNFFVANGDKLLVLHVFFIGYMFEFVSSS